MFKPTTTVFALACVAMFSLFTASCQELDADTSALADVMETEPSPTSTTLSGDSNEKRGWICLDDSLEPRSGISLKNGLSDPCGINNVVAVFSEISTDKSYFHIVTTGIFEVTSNSAGEVGEWLQPSKNTLRIPVGSSVNLTCGRILAFV